MDNQEIVTKKKRTKDDLVVYHLDISSCVGKEMNDFLFQLLYLQHIDTDGCSFHVNPNMAFFIEIPSKFDLFSKASDILYTLFPRPKFLTVDVNETNNPFQLGKEEQYCIKWIKEFQAGNLRRTYSSSETPNTNPDTINDLPATNCNDFMKSFFNQLTPSIGQNPLQYTIFFKFLFTQFKILVDSKSLVNRRVYNHPIQYKHEATKNAIEIAKELFFTDASAKEKDLQFCLCKKWQYSKFFLINQDGN
ncbi:hypothetical protein RFI_29781 [Reticulomyxa filosa]|uniref:Uncharacterized protein n=1 Tax=Reticulomyxa filosa TaxID=46433 RepID=X6M2G8_RETFI|nr:hypothetical protein RFI_29781 [Reticulomyxa filosa]|eukprot:ETO07612.1 hypothetical protein RFI_29781 [Reticulomyxa filosa]